MTGDIELTKLPRRGIAPLLESARATLGSAARRVPPAARQLFASVRTRLPKAKERSRTAGLAREPRRTLEGLFARARTSLKGKAHGFLVQARTLLANDARPKWFLVAVGAAGLGVAVGLFAVVASLVRSGETAGRSLEPVASASPSTSASEPSVVASTTGGAEVVASTVVPVVPPVAPPAPPVPCTVAGSAHVIAPNATVAAGVEVVHLGGDVALGFASSDLDALALRLDLDSLAAVASAKAHAHDPIRRVTPTSGPRGALSLLVDADRQGDRVQGRRTVAADPALQLGAADGQIVWARANGGPGGELWHLDEGPSIEALRGATEGDGSERTTALAFRRGSAIWMGIAVGSAPLESKGQLTRVEGLGTVVGSPAVAINDGSVLVVWADRPSSEDPWRLRWTRFGTGSAPSTPQTFVPPAGGKGEQAMSPAVTSLTGGRFLLVWTEGPAAGHDVRALTLARDGQPIGAPLVISNPGVNAGQGQAGVVASGKGVVAFLESSGSAFQVAATPIACAQ
jgi:hypothetical protein